MPRILLEVDATYRHVLFDLTEATGRVSGGQVYQTAAGVSVTFRGSHGLAQRGWPVGPQAGAEILQFVLEWGGGEALSVVAGWLFAKLQGKVKQVRINRKTVPVTERDILEVLREAQGEIRAPDREEG